MGVEPGADGGAAERDPADPPERGLDPVDTEADLGGIAAELLAEGHRHGVHEMGAARLGELGEGTSPFVEGVAQLGERRYEGLLAPFDGGEVHRGGEDVVRALTQVDVIVRMNVRSGAGWR